MMTWTNSFSGFNTWAGFYPFFMTNILPPQHSPKMRSAYSCASSAGLQTPDSSGPWLPGDWKHCSGRQQRCFLRQRLQNWIVLILFRALALKMRSNNPRGCKRSFHWDKEILSFQLYISMKLGFFFFLMYSTKTTHCSILNTEADRRLWISFKLDYLWIF